MKAVKKIEISVLHKRITPVVYAVQGDTGREIECTVVDWDIPSGVAARVWVVKPSKKVVYNDCRIADKSVFVPMTNQTLAEPGGAICMIEFVSGEDVVSSFSFNLYVYESVSGDGIPSENESTVLEGMFEELAQDAINTLNEAKAQAAAAKKSAQDTEKIKNDFTLTSQQATADVNNAGQTQTQRVNTAGDTQVSRVQAEGTTQVQNVQATAAEIAADREQIHTNRDNVAQLQRNSAGAITRSAEGSFITLEDAADGMGFRRLEIPGETRQRTTSGAQLFDGVWTLGAISTSDGSDIEINTPSIYIRTDYIKADGTITISCQKSMIVGSAYIFMYDVNKVKIAHKSVYSKLENLGTVELPDGTAYVRLMIEFKETVTTPDFVNVMLNAGETALPWEPYTGAAPSPSPEYPQSLDNVGTLNEAGKYKVKVTSCGKNLFGGRALADRIMEVAPGSTVDVDSGTIKFPSSGISGKILYDKFEPGKQYTIIIFGKNTNPESNFANITVKYEDETYEDLRFASIAEMSYVVYTTKNATVTSLVGTWKSQSTELQYDKCGIFEGVVDLDLFTPYRGHTATITSDRPLTKWDKLTCRDGVWGWAYGGSTTVYDGSNDETWTLQSINGNGIANFQITLNGAVSNFDSPNMCSHFPHQTEAIANATKTGFLISNSTGKSILYIRVPSTTASTVETFKAWLAEHIMTVQYQTDTETWVPLSTEEQAAMNALCTYSGTTHIWTDDPMQPVISLDYTVDTEGYIRDTAPAYRDVERFAITGEASGAMATCTDSADWPLLGVGMKGKCEQVTTAGAQLFDAGTIIDDVITIHFTPMQLEANTEYTLSSDTAKDYDGAGAYLFFASGEHTSGSFTTANDGVWKSNPRTVLSDANGYVTIIYKQKVNGYLKNGNIMLNKGATAIPWEPYTGGAPSPSPAYPQEVQETGTYNPETGMYEADMVMTGAQLLNADQFTVEKNGVIFTAKEGTITVKGTATNHTSILLGKATLQPGTYTLSGCPKGGSNAKYQLVLYGERSIYDMGNGSTFNVTAKNDSSVSFYVYAGNTVDLIVNPMLNAGSTALPWETYQSDTLLLTADQHWRGIGDVHDEVCERDGVLGTWRRFAEDILDGSEDEKWVMADCSEPSHKRFCSNLIGTKTKPSASNADTEPLLCNAYKTFSANSTFSQKQGVSVGATGTFAIYDNTFSPTADLSGFKAHLAEYPITVVYQLKEPYFEPFPEDIQKQYRKLKSYAGTTHAWVDDPLQPEVSFKYVKDSKLVLGKLEDRLAALELGQAQTTAAFSYLPPEIQAAMIENETRDLLSTIQEEKE